MIVCDLTRCLLAVAFSRVLRLFLSGCCCSGNVPDANVLELELSFNESFRATLQLRIESITSRMRDNSVGLAMQ